MGHHLLALLAVGCGLFVGPGCGGSPCLAPPSSPPPAGKRAAARLPFEAEPLHPAGVRPPLRELCAPKTQSAFAPRGKVHFELGELVIEPLPFGPLVRNKPQRGLPADPSDVSYAAERRRQLLRRCYRWARYNAPALGEVRLSFELELDPWGIATSVVARPEPKSAAGDALGRCASDVLVGLRLRSAPLRRTRVRLAIAFRPSGQKPPRRPPARPAKDSGAGPPAGVCVQLAGPVVVDQLRVGGVLYTVDDFDPRQAHEDARRNRERWLRGGKQGPAPGLPPLIHRDYAVISVGFDRLHVRRTLLDNLGRYRRCYVEALERRPGLAGVLDVKGFIAPGGQVHPRVRGEGLDDGELRRCLRRALEEVRFRPLLWSRRTLFSLKLRLRPDTTRPACPAAVAAGGTLARVEARAACHLRLGDGETALRGYSALLAGAPKHPRACRWRAGALAAVLIEAPWIDDRALAASRALLGRLAQLELTAARACLERAAPLLAQLAARPRLASRGSWLGHTSLARAVDSHKRLLDGPLLSPAARLQLRLADALMWLGRFEEAARTYRAAAGGGDGEARKQLQDAIAYSEEQVQRRKDR